MFLGPIHPQSPYVGGVQGHSPIKPIKVSMGSALQTVLFDNTYPYALQSNAPETVIDTVIYASTQAAALALVHQIEEMAQNAEWQRCGLFIQWREDGVSDGEDGWYIIKSAEISEDIIFSAYAEPKIDVELRLRQNQNMGVYVDAKAVPNDYNLSGVALAAYPQGIGATIYPASTWTYTGKDGASILVVESAPQILKAQGTTFAGANSIMTSGRCSCFDSTTNDSTATEVFWKDHRFLNGFVKFDNDLVRYTVNLGTPGEPLIEVASASAWVTLGNIQINSGNSTVQAVSIQTISPEEVVWVEERYGNGAYFRVVNRLRRGSRLIECTLVAAGNTSYNQVGAVQLINVPAGITGLQPTADGTAIVGTGGTTIVPGFSYITKPPNGGTWATGVTIDSGLVIPAGTIVRYAIIAALQDAGQWVTYARPGTPTAGSVTPQGTTGTTNYGYQIWGVSSNGTASLILETSTTTGNATLTGTNKNLIAWTAGASDATYTVVRVAGGANNGGQGIVATGLTAVSFTDIGSTPTTLNNTLSTNQASIETDATGWTAMTNCSISRITTQSFDGAASLQLSSTAAGDMKAQLNPLHTIGVKPGASITAQAHFRAAASPRACSVSIRWYNASNVTLGLDATSATVNDTTTGWTLAQVVATAPPGTVTADIYVTVAATAGAAELHDIDAMVLIPSQDVSQPQTYATKLSSYNRTRVRQRILVAG
jgi:hypothetical protein